MVKRGHSLEWSLLSLMHYYKYFYSLSYLKLKIMQFLFNQFWSRVISHEYFTLFSFDANVKTAILFMLNVSPAVSRRTLLSPRLSCRTKAERFWGAFGAFSARETRELWIVANKARLLSTT